jgi:hypothetical protein
MLRMFDICNTYDILNMFNIVHLVNIWNITNIFNLVNIFNIVNILDIFSLEFLHIYRHVMKSIKKTSNVKNLINEIKLILYTP